MGCVYLKTYGLRDVWDWETSELGNDVDFRTCGLDDVDLWTTWIWDVWNWGFVDS